MSPPRKPPPRTSPPEAPAHGVPVLAALASLLVLGCALTNKAEPMQPRYFSPERSGALERPARTPSDPVMELRIGHVRAASYLDERMVFRDSPVELGYYQERRWTEAPEEYLRRRIEWALFEERGLRRVVGGAAPTLEVELLAFEEIRKPKRVARVQVSVRLQDARLVRWEETLTVDLPVTGPGKEKAADELVLAIGEALGQMVNRIAEHVTTELSASPRAAPPSEARK